MPTADEFRRLAGVYTDEERRLRDAAHAVETVGGHDVFDGVMQRSHLEFAARGAAVELRAAADMCAHLATTCLDRAAVADLWADHHRRYERALATWREHIERSGAGGRPRPPARPAPWVDR